LIAVTRGEDGIIGPYLAGVRDAAGVPVRIISEPGLKGPRAAWVRGRREAQGDFVALVGPPVVVTDAWLDQLVALTDCEAAIGSAGPAGPGATPRLDGRPAGWQEGTGWQKKTRN
jgi:hypothetical protein